MPTTAAAAKKTTPVSAGTQNSSAAPPPVSRRRVTPQTSQQLSNIRRLFAMLLYVHFAKLFGAIHMLREIFTGRDSHKFWQRGNSHVHSTFQLKHRVSFHVSRIFHCDFWSKLNRIPLADPPHPPALPSQPTSTPSQAPPLSASALSPLSFSLTRWMSSRGGVYYFIHTFTCWGQKISFICCIYLTFLCIYPPVSNIGMENPV